jgi:hypothetical protein
VSAEDNERSITENPSTATVKWQLWRGFVTSGTFADEPAKQEGSMPDEAGNQKADPVETPLHAYKDGREDDIEPGDLGTNPDGSRLPEGADEAGSFQRGGHAADPETADPVEASEESEPAGTAGGAFEDTVTHPEAGDQGLGSKTGGLDGPVE